MLHTNFECHRPFGSREEEFLRFLPYMVRFFKVFTIYDKVFNVFTIYGNRAR